MFSIRSSHEIKYKLLLIQLKVSSLFSHSKMNSTCILQSNRLIYRTLDSRADLIQLSLPVNMDFMYFPRWFFSLSHVSLPFFSDCLRLYLFLLNFRMNCCIKLDMLELLSFSFSAFYMYSTFLILKVFWTHTHTLKIKHNLLNSLL